MAVFSRLTFLLNLININFIIYKKDQVENDEEEAYESISDEENLEYRSKVNKENPNENIPNADTNRQK